MAKHHSSRGVLTPETPPCVRLCLRVTIKLLRNEIKIPTVKCSSSVAAAMLH